jgi:DeoR family transcriptional regulator, catabolite repression regulator
LEIVELVKQNAPITGDQIAEMLGLSKPTIRSDLSVLVMLGYLDAKPKVGYFPGKAMAPEGQMAKRLLSLKVKDIQGVPVIMRDTATVQEAVVTLFLENVGSVIVADENGTLQGVISRKDLLKVTLGNPSASSMLISLVMTRHPNIVTANEEESVLDAARKMITHQIDSLPVLRVTSQNGVERQEVVGRVTKTSMTNVLVELAQGLETGG